MNGSIKRNLGIPTDGIDEFLRKVDLLKYVAIPVSLSVYEQDLTGSTVNGTDKS